MKTPRTITIVSLMLQVVSSILKGEKMSLKGGLARLDKLGGVYIKFLQMVVLNLDASSQVNFQDLLAVYERSTPDELDIDDYLSRHNPSLVESLVRIEPRPFATGSFGQVYYAQLVSGERVIIKVLRPSVVRYLRSDLRLLNLLSFIYSVADRQKMLNFRNIYREFRESCLNETNYEREAMIADQYYQDYRYSDRLIIPKTHLPLSNKRVIVQDYIQGLSLTELLALQAEGADAREYVRTNLGSDLYVQLRTIGTELLSKALVGDMLQADPHPGNIILLPGNQVALIDFGMVAGLSENRLAFYKLLVEYEKFYRGNLAIEDFAFAALSFLAPDLHRAITQADRFLDNSESSEQLTERIKQKVTKIFYEEFDQEILANMLEQKMIMKILFFAINKGNRFGFSFDLHSVNLLKAAHTYLVLLGKFDDNCEVISDVTRDAIIFGQQNLDRLVAGSDKKKQADTLETLSTWFDKMARNDPWLMDQLISGYIK